MIRCILGVDMGASGVKAALLDLDTFKISPVVTPSYDNGVVRSAAI